MEQKNPIDPATRYPSVQALGLTYLGASDILGPEEAAQKLRKEAIGPGPLVEKIAAELYDLPHHGEEKVGKRLLVLRLKRGLDDTKERQKMPERRLDALPIILMWARAQAAEEEL
jgi:hypothetical protein